MLVRHSGSVSRESLWSNSRFSLLSLLLHMGVCGSILIYLFLIYVCFILIYIYIYIYIYPQLVSNTRTGRGMRCEVKPLYYRSVSSKGAGRPRLTRGWNETKWMRWVWRNGGMKFVVGENERNPMKNLPRPRFVHHETHMEGPRRELGTPAMGGERLTACTTRPPLF